MQTRTDRASPGTNFNRRVDIPEPPCDSCWRKNRCTDGYVCKDFKQYTLVINRRKR